LGEYLGRLMFGASEPRTGGAEEDPRQRTMSWQFGELLAFAYTGQLDAQVAAGALRGASSPGPKLLRDFLSELDLTLSAASSILAVSSTTLSLASNGKTPLSLRLSLELIAVVLLDLEGDRQERLLDATNTLLTALRPPGSPSLEQAMDTRAAQTSPRQATDGGVPEPLSITAVLDATRSLADETNVRLLLLAHAGATLNATEYATALQAMPPCDTPTATSHSSISRRLRLLASQRWLIVDHALPQATTNRDKPSIGHQTVYRWNEETPGQKMQGRMPAELSRLWSAHLEIVGLRLAEQLAHGLRTQATPVPTTAPPIDEPTRPRLSAILLTYARAQRRIRVRDSGDEDMHFEPPQTRTHGA
ncbi:MAG: hypothetical protein RLZZ461_1462, partial [Planctomycetota bacterium]|jgi:hypothetical protein